MSKVFLDSLGNPVPEDAYIVRSTEVSEFTDCRRKWYLRSQNGMHLESRKLNKNLGFGTIMHKGFEALRLGKDPMVALEEQFAAIAAATPEDILFEEDDGASSITAMHDLATGLMQHLVEWMPDNYPKRKVVEVERRLLLPVLAESNKANVFVMGSNHMMRQLYLTAKIDGLEIDEQGNYWVSEFKTISKSTNLDNINHVELDAQASYNLQITRQLWPDRTILGSSYLFIRKQLPSSRVKNPIIRHLVVRRNAAQVTAYYRHLLHVAGDMSRITSGDVVAYPSFPSTGGSQCEWKCDLRPICEAVNRDEDVDGLLQATTRERDSFTEMMMAEMTDIKIERGNEDCLYRSNG